MKEATLSDLKPFFQILRDRLSISDIIGPHVRLIRKGNEFKGLCPFHNEKTPSFKVNDEKASYHCFGCGVHGDIFEFVMQKLNMTFMDAVEYLADIAGLEVPKSKADNPGDNELFRIDPSHYKVLEAACQWFQTQLTLSHGFAARAYLEQRQLLPETISEFRLGYAPHRGLEAALLSQGFSRKTISETGLTGISDDNSKTYDRFRDRLMFPIWDNRGRVVAFGGRLLKEDDKKTAKYLNSPDIPTFSKGKMLYAYRKAVSGTEKGKPMIVAEGYMDVIALHQAGFKTAVAPLGTALTLDQIALLWRMKSNPVICFDGDKAGIRAAYRAAELVREEVRDGKTLTFCFLPDEQDPDSLLQAGKKDYLAEKLDKPVPLSDVLWSMFSQGRKISTPEEKVLAQKDMEFLLSGFKNSDIRKYYWQDFNERLRNLLSIQNVKNNDKARKQHSYKKISSGLSANLSHNSSFELSGSKIVVDKNLKIQKILLATLLNHPTLIEEVEEGLVAFGDWVSKYDELLQEMVGIFNKDPSLSASDLQKQLRGKGFSDILANILAADVYHGASFCRQTATREEALKGWEQLWHHDIDKPRIVQEEFEKAHELSANLTKDSWNQLKASRMHTIDIEDEKKGA